MVTGFVRGGQRHRGHRLVRERMKLEIKGLTKRFGSFTANDRIDLVVEPGEIHCLLGENGAGKSTLMNMLYGLLDPTEGEIALDGSPVSFSSPGDAIDAGIGMVHQHFMLVPVFTVAENVMLGREQTRGLGVLNRSAAAELVRELSEPLQPRRRPGCARRRPAGRGPAARGDPQGAGQRRPGADPRRADRGAHPAGDRRADGDHDAGSRSGAPRSSSSPTSSARSRRSETGSASSVAARWSAPPSRAPARRTSPS